MKTLFDMVLSGVVLVVIIGLAIVIVSELHP